MLEIPEHMKERARLFAKSWIEATYPAAADGVAELLVVIDERAKPVPKCHGF